MSDTTRLTYLPSTMIAAVAERGAMTYTLKMLKSHVPVVEGREHNVELSEYVSPSVPLEGEENTPFCAFNSDFFLNEPYTAAVGLEFAAVACDQLKNNPTYIRIEDGYKFARLRALEAHGTAAKKILTDYVSGDMTKEDVTPLLFEAFGQTSAAFVRSYMRQNIPIDKTGLIFGLDEIKKRGLDNDHLDETMADFYWQCSNHEPFMDFYGIDSQKKTTEQLSYIEKNKKRVLHKDKLYSESFGTNEADVFLARNGLPITELFSKGDMKCFWENVSAIDYTQKIFIASAAKQADQILER